MTVAPGSPGTRKAFAVWFKDLERWSADYFRRVEWQWPSDVLKPIGEALQYRRVEVDDTADPVQVPIIEKISFSGVVSVTQPGQRAGYKGRLFWAEPGNLVYSKIRVKQGSLAIVPERVGRLAVSAEYPVYEVDAQRADGQYLELVVRSSPFLRMLDGIAHGGSTKTRIPPDEFEKLAIPLPPLAVQLAIVSAWGQAQAEIAETRRQIAELEGQIEAEFLADLALTKPKHAALPKVFAVDWKDLERWSVTFNQLDSVSVDISAGEYPVVALGTMAAVSYGIQKCPANRPGQHARPYLRVANVQRGELDLREIKTIDVPDADMPSFRLEPGDLLVCEGNSADLVGRPAIWRGEIPDCVHQNHILKVRVDPAQALPGYVLEYMQTTPARAHFRTRAKFTTNLASINSNDLRELPVPLPPLAVQRELVAKVKAQRERITALKAEADRKAEWAKAEVEAIILGERAITV